ncbi:unnamed protein product [Cuscuta epithymum]|uniref:Protein kinase domain-containing protein n=1 Tax=Cuscuta epithymum TaxID=186058 RepID=A0AAV0BZW3_9ASTE|nr:unnamed protein product [Cuscuta epithymum]
MPSRDFPSSPPPPPPLRPQVVHGQTHRLVPLLAVGIAAATSVLLIFTFCCRKFSGKRPIPSPADTVQSKPPHRFSYAALRRATSNFDPSLRLGQGGFGSVYRGALKVSGFQPDVPVAVKVMDAGSLQGEREFQNELFFAGKLDSDHIVPIIGFSSDQKCCRMVLVYDLMANGSLQDCLLHRKCSELKIWKNRFTVALDIAKGLEYLHHSCDPSVIHGDIKPSNILLDSNFKAKIGDFGLARLKPQQDHVEIEVKKEGSLGNVEDDIEETESVTTTTNGFEEFHGGLDLSPETQVVSPRTVAAMASPPDGSLGNFDGFSVESGKETSDKKKSRLKKSVSRNDWWWKQDTAGVDSGRPVKDYVKEWIGNEIKKEKPTSSELIGGASSSTKTEKKKKNRKRSDWWVSMEDEKTTKVGKRRPAREWWKEEYCEELQRKKKKKKKQGKSCNDATGGEIPSRKSSSMDWWLDGISGDLWRARRNSYDSVASGEIPKSGISSTPSMRGTVCYAAPEYGVCGDHLSEKCDVYSYGVLLLVLISGRRPLQVTGSPMSEFQRANLLSWARHLARAGKLLDLVDQSVESLVKEEALLCIKLALVCLQKSPARRPSMNEVVRVLSGELGPLELPVELSSSHASRFGFKKVR